MRFWKFVMSGHHFWRGILCCCMTERNKKRSMEPLSSFYSQRTTVWRSLVNTSSNGPICQLYNLTGWLRIGTGACANSFPSTSVRLKIDLRWKQILALEDNITRNDEVMSAFGQVWWQKCLSWTLWLLQGQFEFYSSFQVSWGLRQQII